MRTYHVARHLDLTGAGSTLVITVSHSLGATASWSVDLTAVSHCGSSVSVVVVGSGRIS